MDNPIIGRQEAEDDRNANFSEWVENNYDDLRGKYNEFYREEKSRGVDKVKPFNGWISDYAEEMEAQSYEASMESAMEQEQERIEAYREARGEDE